MCQANSMPATWSYTVDKIRFGSYLCERLAKYFKCVLGKIGN